MSEAQSTTPEAGTVEAIARNTDGSIKDQSQTTQPVVEEKKDDTKTEPKTETKKDGKEPSLLNDKPKEGEKKDATVPEKYDFKLPDGFSLTEEVNTEVTTLFKDLGLSNEGAQKLVDFHAKQLSDAVAAPHKLWADTQKAWQDEVKADPEIGKKLPEVKATVSKAIDGLGDPKLAASFREAMDITGAGNHPAFVKAFYKLAQMVTEGKSVMGKGPVEVKAPGSKPASAASAMYPNL